MKVNNFFESQKDEENVTLPNHAFRQKAVAVWNISKNTPSAIFKQQLEDGEVSTPKRSRRKRKLPEIDEFNLCVNRRIIHWHFQHNETVFLNKLLLELQKVINFPHKMTT